MTPWVKQYSQPPLSTPVNQSLCGLKGNPTFSSYKHTTWTIHWSPRGWGPLSPEGVCGFASHRLVWWKPSQFLQLALILPSWARCPFSVQLKHLLYLTNSLLRFPMFLTFLHCSGWCPHRQNRHRLSSPHLVNRVLAVAWELHLLSLGPVTRTGCVRHWSSRTSTSTRSAFSISPKAQSRYFCPLVMSQGVRELF